MQSSVEECDHNQDVANKKTAIIELGRHQFHIRMPSMCHLASFEEGIVHIPLSFTGEISFVTSYEGSDKRI